MGTVGGIYTEGGGGKIGQWWGEEWGVAARRQSCRVRDRRWNRDSESKSVAVGRSWWNVVTFFTLRLYFVPLCTRSFSRSSVLLLNDLTFNRSRILRQVVTVTTYKIYK